METGDAADQPAAENEHEQQVDEQKLQHAHSRLQQLDPRSHHGLGTSLLKTARSRWVHVRDVMQGIARAMKFAHHKTDVFQLNSREVIAQAQSGAIKVQLQPAEARDLHNINWMQQGNADFYTADMVAQRYQLRAASAVVSTVQTWWRFLLSWQIRSLSSDSDGPPTLDDVASCELLRPVYSAMVVAIQMVLLPRFGMEGDPGYDPEDDWQSDCKGQPTLSYANFFDAMFELADMWCETVNAGDYASLLNKALEDVQQQEQQTGLFASALRRFKSAAPRSPELQQQQEEQQQQHGEEQQQQQRGEEQQQQQQYGEGQQQQQEGDAAGQQHQTAQQQAQPPQHPQQQEQAGQPQQQEAQQQEAQQQEAQQQEAQQQQAGQQPDSQGHHLQKGKKQGGKGLQQKIGKAQPKQEEHPPPQQQQQQKKKKETKNSARKPMHSHPQPQPAIAAPKISSSGACPAFKQAIEHSKRGPSEMEASHSQQSLDGGASAAALLDSGAMDEGAHSAGAMHVMPPPEGLSDEAPLGAVQDAWRDIPWYNKYMTSVISKHQQQQDCPLLPPTKQRQGGVVNLNVVEMLPPSDMGDAATLLPARASPLPSPAHQRPPKQAGAGPLRPDGLTAFEAYVVKKVQSQDEARLQPLTSRPQQLQPLRVNPGQPSPGPGPGAQQEEDEDAEFLLGASPSPRHRLNHFGGRDAAPLQLPRLKNAPLGGVGPIDLLKARKRREQEAEAKEEHKLQQLERARAIEAMYEKEKAQAVWTSAFNSKTRLSSDNTLMQRQKHLGYIPHNSSRYCLQGLPPLLGQRDGTCAGSALHPHTADGAPRDAVRLPSIFG